MNRNAIAMRPTGVTVPGSQQQAPRAAGAPRTLTGFVEAKTYAIEYTDVDGVHHQTMALHIGGRWYLSPNGENFAASLRPASDWLLPHLEERRLNENTSTLPKQDAVDVIGG